MDEVLRCNNCGVSYDGSRFVGHSSNTSGSHVWWCSMRCFYGPQHTAPLLLIRGLPGSGKSTLARSASYKARWPVHLEADMFHMRRGEYVYVPERAAQAHKWCLDTTRVMLNSGQRVVVSNTFVTFIEIAPYIDLGFEFAIEELRENWGSTHNVPEDVMAHMRKNWQELRL